MNKQNVLFVANRLIASNIIGIIKPMLELQREQEVEFRMKYAFNYKESDIIWADTVVLCRAIDVELLKIIDLVQKHQKKLIYDIDDNFFELSIQNPLGKYHRWPLHLYTVREMIRNADAVRVYSHPMEENASKWNENTFRLKSYFDFKLIENLKRQPQDKIRIVYASGRGNSDSLAQLCLPAVAKILEEYPDKTEFYIFGSIPKYMKHLKNIRKLKYISDYSKYIQFSWKMGFDIGLAPLLDDRYHNSKTNNKYREYGAMGVCGIYSSTEIYRECIQNGKNGLLVENTSEAWHDAIRALIEDEALRKKIKEESYQDIKENYSMENTIQDWRKILTIRREDKPEFRLYKDVKVTLLYDQNNTKATYRINQLSSLMGITGIDYKGAPFQQADLWKLRDCDVCICFASKNNQIKQWISALNNYGYKNIIMDTLCPFDECKEYPEIIFTNTQAIEPNCYPIRDLYSLESTNLEETTKQTLVMPGNDLSFCDLFQFGQKQINKTEERVYSLDNPAVQWIDLLSRYSNPNKKEPGFFAVVWQKLLPKLHGLQRGLLKIGKVIGKPFVWIYHKIFDRISWSITCAIGSYKINRRKKY